MKSINEESVKTLLLNNYINRNTQLETFIRFINSFDSSQTLAIDGAWGSGKTVFVKQLVLLCENNELTENIPDISQDDVKDLRDNYTSIYYNAWENDYFDDVLQSILYNLVVVIDKTSGGLNENALKIAFSKFNITGLVKNITHDAIELEGQTIDESLIEGIRSLVDRKARIKETLEELVSKTSKKILFVIDELDRCSPSFAVKVLETIKHYFELDGIAFVIAVNTEQLEHTIKKFYGNEFDGYGYLNKFFDFPFSLKRPDTKAFASNYLNKTTNTDIATRTPIEVVDYLKMNMREIESYYTSLDLIQDYMKRQGFQDKEGAEYIIQYIFVPLALALKIKSISKYSSFVSGSGRSLLMAFLQISPGVISFAGQFCKDKKLTISGTDSLAVRDIIINFVVDTYEELFNNQDDNSYRRIYNTFVDAITIVSSYMTIVPKNNDTEEYKL